MYSLFRNWCERVLRIPHDPTPPPGDEASARVFRAAPAYLKYLIVLYVLRLVLFLLVVGVAETGLIAAVFNLPPNRPEYWSAMIILPAFSFLVVLAIVGAIIQFALLRLDFDKRWYVVTNRSLRIREGVIQVREMTITFANIQNLSVMQGPVQRWLGIADLQVETAGGGAATRGSHSKHAGPNLHEAFFRGIDNAEEVKQLIQERLRALKDSGLGDHEEVEAAPQPALLDALRAVHAEARALRAAAASWPG